MASDIPNTSFPFDSYKLIYVDANQGIVSNPHNRKYSNPLGDPAVIDALRKSLEGCVLIRRPNALVTFHILDE